MVWPPFGEDHVRLLLGDLWVVEDNDVTVVPCPELHHIVIIHCRHVVAPIDLINILFFSE
jgi:hypothetical protein